MRVFAIPQDEIMINGATRTGNTRPSHERNLAQFGIGSGLVHCLPLLNFIDVCLSNETRSWLQQLLSNRHLLHSFLGSLGR
jgi:hypothetical protein